MSGPSSLPYSGMPASSRSVSRAASPAGTRPAGAPRRRQRGPDPGHPRAGRTPRSRPRRCTRSGPPRPGSPPRRRTLRRSTSSRPGPARSAGARIPAAAGPWMAISAVLAVCVRDRRLTRRPARAARRSTAAVFDAFATTRNSCSPCRYTTRSSSTPPSGAQIIVYRARPGAQRRQRPGQRVVQRRAGPRPGHRDLAHVGQVEQPGRVPHRLVLGRLAPVAQRHLPAGERGHDRPEPLVHLKQRGMA